MTGWRSRTEGKTQAKSTSTRKRNAGPARSGEAETLGPSEDCDSGPGGTLTCRPLMCEAAPVCFLMTPQHIGIGFSHRAETDGRASWCKANWEMKTGTGSGTGPCISSSATRAQTVLPVREGTVCREVKTTVDWSHFTSCRPYISYKRCMIMKRDGEKLRERQEEQMSQVEESEDEGREQRVGRGEGVTGERKRGGGGGTQWRGKKTSKREGGRSRRE